jgi:uncharacterized protein (DUF427 family)
MRVSDDMRKQNAYWVKRRDTWRKHYKALASEIAFYKNEIRRGDKQMHYDLVRQMRVALVALQERARDMMWSYETVISGMLRATAYRYEDAE